MPKTLRAMEITTPVGDDVLLFYGMHAREELGRLSEYQLDLLSQKKDINPDDLLGKSVTVKIELPDESTRFFNGFVTRFAQGGTVGRYNRYSAFVNPWLWFLTRTTDCRIFQEMTVPDIVKKVFADHPTADFKFELTGSYRKWDYCVQYRETDFNFVSRLLEEEGIYFYTRHTDGHHTIVLTDSMSKHETVPGYEKISFISPHDLVRPELEHIGSWDFSRTIQPGVYVHDDYDLERPSVELKTRKVLSRTYSPSDYEIYDYPGHYLQKPDGEQYADVRINEFGTQFETARGISNSKGIHVGSLFTLEDFPRDDQNAEYLVVSASYDLEFSGYESMPDSAGTSYQCSFVAMPSKQQFRPRRATPKPFVQGPQTAVVVGPGGEEIYTDKYGRVKVQFHWDRYGKKDENSSCWIRVSSPWAGKAWGTISTPRIGQEVVVAFLEGDPDQPIIVGRVYNAEQMPPYDLPGNKTQSGMKSRSSMGGGPANFNEIRFEDKSGSEQLFIHAEKNQDIEVEKDETHWVGHDRAKTIDHDEMVHVKHDRTEVVDNDESIFVKHDRTETVTRNEVITIGNDHTKTIGGTMSLTVSKTKSENVLLNSAETIGIAKELTVGGLYQVTVGAAHNTTVGAAKAVEVGGSSTELVGGGKSLTVGGAHTVTVNGAESIKVIKDRSLDVQGKSSQTIKGEHVFKAKKIDITAEEELTITVGSAKLVMKKDGSILFDGKDVDTKASGKVNIKASSDIILKGSSIKEN